jgi:hypothetical protein
MNLGKVLHCSIIHHFIISDALLFV